MAGFYTTLFIFFILVFPIQKYVTENHPWQSVESKLNLGNGCFRCSRLEVPLFIQPISCCRTLRLSASRCAFCFSFFSLLQIMPEKSSLHKCIPLSFSEISTSRRNQIAGSKDRCILNCDRRCLSVLYRDYFKEASCFLSVCECDTFTRLFKVEFSSEVVSETQGSHPPSPALCRDVLILGLAGQEGSKRQTATEGREPDGAGQM